VLNDQTPLRKAVGEACSHLLCVLPGHQNRWAICVRGEREPGREHAREAVLRLRALGDALATALRVSEIRTVDADVWWLSPFHHRAGTAFHFTWAPDADAVRVASACPEACPPDACTAHRGSSPGWAASSITLLA